MIQISSRLFWSIVIGFVVLVVVVGALYLFRPFTPKGQSVKGQKVTDPQKILELEHPELEYTRKPPPGLGR